MKTLYVFTKEDFKRLILQTHFETSLQSALEKTMKDEEIEVRFEGVDEVYFFYHQSENKKIKETSNQELWEQSNYIPPSLRKKHINRGLDKHMDKYKLPSKPTHFGKMASQIKKNQDRLEELEFSHNPIDELFDKE